MMNYAKILSISVVVLVVLAILSVFLTGTVLSGANGALLASGFQVAVIAFGLSAIALALLRLSYRNDKI
jgi:hypothetical protein